METEKDALVGISEASQILGVSEPALRVWTDEGNIKSFITPGGHRRYSRAELKKFLNSNKKMVGLKDLAAKLQDSVPVHREIAISFLQSISWYSRMDLETQHNFGVLGRSLLTLIVKSISEPSKQDENLVTYKELGGKYGVMTADLGLSLIDSLQAFIRHRDPILSVVSEMMKKSEILNRRISTSINMVDNAMDQALIALVSAHQERKALTLLRSNDKLD
jgi:excisionase family DNA binding protein